MDVVWFDPHPQPYAHGSFIDIVASLNPVNLNGIKLPYVCKYHLSRTDTCTLRKMLATPNDRDGLAAVQYAKWPWQIKFIFDKVSFQG